MEITKKFISGKEVRMKQTEFNKRFMDLIFKLETLQDSYPEEGSSKEEEENVRNEYKSTRKELKLFARECNIEFDTFETILPLMSARQRFGIVKEALKNKEQGILKLELKAVK